MIRESQTTREELYTRIDRLVEQYRLCASGFAPRDYLPNIDEERLATLADIERYGDREAFMRSRELREWLLQAARKEYST